MLLKRVAPWEVLVLFLRELLFRFISARECCCCVLFRVALPNSWTKLKLRLQKKPHSSINLLGISVSLYSV